MNKNNSHNKIASILLSILAGVMLCASLTLLPPEAGEGLEPVNVEINKNEKILVFPIPICYNDIP